MMDTMTVKERFGQLNMVASFRARPQSELHSLNVNPRSGRVMQSRDRSWL
jgi:hypothetical protein